MGIILGTFKDTEQTFYINVNNKSDSLRRTVVESNATIFDTIAAANVYLDKMEKESHRFNECTFLVVE